MGMLLGLWSLFVEFCWFSWGLLLLLAVSLWAGQVVAVFLLDCQEVASRWRVVLLRRAAARRQLVAGDGRGGDDVREGYDENDWERN